MKIIGLMSGTSADGVDSALVEINHRGNKLQARLIAFEVYAYPPVLKERIFRLFRDRRGSLSLACQLNMEIGEAFATAALKVIKRAGIKPRDIAAIGSHGQTVYHIPPTLAKKKGLIPSTLQIGDSSVIALRTGIPTVADFRTADMAVGGEGAPLIPFADFHLLSHPRRTRIVQNIGGIANCTVLPGGAESLEEIIAFDTGPGNMVIDALVRIITNGRLNLDKNGSIARGGRINEELLRRQLRHPYFSLPPPKTTGRESFGEDYARRFLIKAQGLGLSGEDTIATATALTVESIVQAYERFIFPEYKVEEVILGGGGAENKTLVNMLRRRLPESIRLLRHEDLGLDSNAKEAIGFAMLAYATLHGMPSNCPSATGASRPVVLGKIYYPEERFCKQKKRRG